jgi:hypothetical protein
MRGTWVSAAERASSFCYRRGQAVRKFNSTQNLAGRNLEFVNLKRGQATIGKPNLRTLFEAELSQRDIVYTIEPESDRYVIMLEGGRLLINLDNLRRDFDRDGDVGRISRFVDIIVSSTTSKESPVAEQLYWNIEPNDYKQDLADFRVPLSDKVDRVLVCVSADNSCVTWVTPEMLTSLGLSESEAADVAFANLAIALSAATVETQEIDGVQLGHIGTKLPFKAALILAPNLKAVVEGKLGWPLMAIAPDRDFLFLWAARHTDFVARVGSVAVREYSQASYPISTEVWEITDEKIRAVGEFPTEA